MNNETLALTAGPKLAHHSDHCLRCGRALTTELSRSRGYGDKCWRRIQRAMARTDLRAGYSAYQVEEATLIVLDAGVTLLRGGHGSSTPVFLVVSTEGDDIHRTAPTGCNCTRGLRKGQPCSHRLVVAWVLAA